LEQALEYTLKSLAASEKANRLMGIVEAYTLNTLGTLYDELGDFPHALTYYDRGLAIRKDIGDKWAKQAVLINIGNVYLKQGDHERAKEFCGQSLAIAAMQETKKEKLIHFFIWRSLGMHKIIMQQLLTPQNEA
jgi:tetratricopeptide (TPR) repeat protein